MAPSPLLAALRFLDDMARVLPRPPRVWCGWSSSAEVLVRLKQVEEVAAESQGSSDGTHGRHVRIADAIGRCERYCYSGLPIFTDRLEEIVSTWCEQSLVADALASFNEYK